MFDKSFKTLIFTQKTFSYKLSVTKINIKIKTGLKNVIETQHFYLKRKKIYCKQN